MVQLLQNKILGKNTGLDTREVFTFLFEMLR